MNHKLFFSLLLICLAILFRTVWHIAPNIEFVTSAALLAGAYLGKRFAIFVPLIIMVISDMIIGNSNIFLFTWSGFVIIGISSYFLFRGKSKTITGKIIQAGSLAIYASIWYFIWTNFGVWLLDSWGMYPRNFSGLLQAFVLAIPFLQYNLLGNVILVPVSFLIVEAGIRFKQQFLKNTVKVKLNI